MQRRVLIAVIFIAIGIVVLSSAWFGGQWLWGELDAYIRPGNATERKELANIFIFIAAGVVGALTAIAALINLYFSRRNLQNAQAALRQQRDLDLSRRADEALQAYFEQTGDLLIDKGLLEKDNPYDTTRVTTRARTLAVLPQLDGERKRWIVQFLYDGQLINTETETAFDFGGPKFTPRIVGLSGADLKNANLRDLTLEYAALNGAILENADLRDAKLSASDLGGAYLCGADLSNAKLGGASLVNAELRGASLVNACLQRQDELNLSAADLSAADLSGANLYEAKGWTEEQLTAARSLEGATMPNGQKYEVWLKSKGRGEDGQNSGPS